MGADTPPPDSAAAGSVGGVSGVYATPPEPAALRVGPATADQFNTLRPGYFPFACWRCDDVRFDFGSSFVRPEIRTEMAQLDVLFRLATVNDAQGQPQLQARLAVFGHADPVGDDDFNKRLSGRRARAVYALLTRNVAAWEDLYDHPHGEDRWGRKSVQWMLVGLGHTTVPTTGERNPETDEALGQFRTQRGITETGDAGPATRRALIAAYMDAIARRADGTALTVAPAQFLGGGRDARGKADYQGCSEFNPLLMFSQAENQEYSRPENKEQRDQENAPNRRVVILLFRTSQPVDIGTWPCPRWDEGPANCRRRFWSDAARRRQFQSNRRLFEVDHDTFACRFYERLTTQSPCERVNRLVQARVLEVRFTSVVPIWYVRLPPAGTSPSYVQPPAADLAGGPPHRFSPAAQRPASGDPHWRKSAATDEAEFSWPAVLVRPGGAGGGPVRATVTFDLVGAATVNTAGPFRVRVSATSDQGLTVAPFDVTFSGGRANNVTVEIGGVPDTVKHLNGVQVTWQFELAGETLPLFVTRHTLLLVNQTPRAADHKLLGPDPYENKYLWDTMVWSCTWADGQAGEDAVRDALWARFNPVAASVPSPDPGFWVSTHPSGLGYWLNWSMIQPAQDLPTAIQSLDDPNPHQRGAGSCIVFDRIWLNVIALQGIACTELMVNAYPLQPTTFTRAGRQYTCSGWFDTTRVGQGYQFAPPKWFNHWISNVILGGQWKLFDASYGVGPLASQAPQPAPPGGRPFVAAPAYEPLAVLSFDTTRIAPPPAGPDPLPLDTNAAVPPHLFGVVLWTNT